MNKAIEIALQQRKEQGLYRKRQVCSKVAACKNFSSNDYLLLSEDSRIKQAITKGLALYPCGSGASMAVCGYHPIHATLEASFADLIGVESAVLFTSGYTANLSIMLLLAHLKATVLIDKNIHASIYDGIRLSNATYTRFLPNNIKDLDAKLQKRLENPVIVVEGIYSMTGQIAKLDAIALRGLTIVDEAHAFGVIGSHGLGTVAAFAIENSAVPLRMIPFSKAMGLQGAVVCGEAAWIEVLLQVARTNIYSTAVSPAMTYGVLESLQILYQAEEKRKRLQAAITYFRQQVQTSPLVFSDSVTPIQQLRLGCPHQALFYTQELQKQGIWCIAMREPTVSRRDTGLRVVLHAEHEPQDIDALFMQLHAIYESTSTYPR